MLALSVLTYLSYYNQLLYYLILCVKFIFPYEMNFFFQSSFFCIIVRFFSSLSFACFCSIKHRTLILQRGLADRSLAVSKECLKLMKDEWLNKGCNGDPLVLLKYLDVETYEIVGESVAGALLKGGEIKVPEGESIRQYILSNSERTEGLIGFSIFFTLNCMYCKGRADIDVWD